MEAESAGPAAFRQLLNSPKVIVMQIHQALVEGMTAILGPPQRRDEHYAWQIAAGMTDVNVLLGLPQATTGVRVWIFDPRREGTACARWYTVDNPSEIEHVMREVRSILGRPPGPIIAPDPPIGPLSD